jgi:hypothetical protein
MVVWQWAVALLGALMGVNPFNQPNVATAKKSVLEVLSHPDVAALEKTVVAASPTLEELLESSNSGDYLCIQAYVDDQEYKYLKDCVVPDLARQVDLPISLVQGPRYLHSIRQLHEGGPNTGIFVMIDNASPDASNVMLSNVDYTLRELFDAQRIGDVIALRSHGRRVAMCNINDLKTRPFALKRSEPVHS